MTERKRERQRDRETDSETDTHRDIVEKRRQERQTGTEEKREK